MLPVRFDDPLYATLARAAEGRHGLPSGLLDAIRLLGERSNANQVSSSGARTPYQFIPATRQGIKRNYGIDPWNSAEDATEGAAALLEENLRRSNGRVEDAVSMYHGGLNRRNWGPRTRAYTERVSGGLMGPSKYPMPYYGPDPLAPLDQPTAMPERPTQPVPVPGDPGPSASAPAAAALPSKKRGGILGALESVFMPDPDSLWAGALRDGVFNAKESQAVYRASAAKQAADTAMTQAKLKNLLTKGEYQIAGNNVIHFPPDGGDPVVITPPATPSEHERLIEAWRRETNPEVKELMQRLLLGANADPVLRSKEDIARTRAGATTRAAQIRANAPSKSSVKGLPPLPPGFSVVK